MCYYMITGRAIKNSSDIEERNILKSINKDIELRLFEIRESENRDYFPFERQELLLSALTCGDVERVKELCGIFLRFRPYTNVDEDLNSYKIRLISFMLVIYRQAVLYGVDESLAAAIYKEFCKKMSHSQKDTEAKDIFLSVVLQYTKRVSDAKTYVVDIDRVNPTIKKAVEYISHHLHSDIIVPDICRYCGVSESYLRINFKRDVGKSIVEYINEQKIAEAKMLLKNTSYTISEIAEYLSFSSQSYFTNIFKKYTGLTPTDYKNTLN